MTIRRLITDVADIADQNLSGKRYHYKNQLQNEPVQKRVGNAVMGFWFRMILIGLAFSTMGSLATIYMGWKKQEIAAEAKAAEEAEAERARKRNPWALER